MSECVIGEREREKEQWPENKGESAISEFIKVAGQLAHWERGVFCCGSKSEC